MTLFSFSPQSKQPNFISILKMRLNKKRERERETITIFYYYAHLVCIKRFIGLFGCIFIMRNSYFFLYIYFFKKMIVNVIL